MLDYISLETNTEYPAFFTVLYTVLLSIFLSCLIAFTHYKTSREIVFPVEFLQSLILVSIVSATVMQAIGDSLARGLGMLGALAIIRYRVTLKTPRNMVFTFAALAAGIACGVYAFVIALIGSIGFCLIAFVLRYSPLSRPNALMGMLKFQIPIDRNVSEVEALIRRYCKNFRKVKFQMGKFKKISPSENSETAIPSIATVSGQISFDYELSFEDLNDCKQLHVALTNEPSITQVKLSFENVNESV